MEKSTNDFIKEYFGQDNCGTAYPIYFQIRDIAWQASYHFEDGERFVFVYDTEQLACADSLEELFKEIKQDEWGYEFNFPEDFDFECIYELDIEEFISLNEHVAGIFAQKKEYEYKNMFLLKSEAEAHLKSNHYHYSKEAVVYCQHAWRAPETERFLNDLNNKT